MRLARSCRFESCLRLKFLQNQNDFISYAFLSTFSHFFSHRKTGKKLQGLLDRQKIKPAIIFQIYFSNQNIIIGLYINSYKSYFVAKSKSKWRRHKIKRLLQRNSSYHKKYSWKKNMYMHYNIDSILFYMNCGAIFTKWLQS